MAKIFKDKDADLSFIKDKKIAVIGYGNQGYAQAHNFRDSGLDVIIGNIDDEYKKKAMEDGFDVYDIEKAAKLGQIICLLIPDEIMAEVYQKKIHPYLGKGNVLDFASGYNIYFNFITPPPDVDVVMVAPRMIGEGVRELYIKGKGFPSLIGIAQNASGNAREIALAIAKGIGSTKIGAIESSFEEETVLDLYTEQVTLPAINELLKLAYEVQKEAGYSPEAILTELYLSGEFARIGMKMANVGLIKQLKLHSRTSQYGQLSRAARIIDKKVKEKARRILNKEIKLGTFAKEWSKEQQAGLPKLKALWKEALNHPINKDEESIIKKLKN